MFRLSDYDYELPRELVAQKPAEPRDSSRLLVLDLAEDTISEAVFRDLPKFLRRGDVLVLNRSRVIKAALEGRKTTGGRVRILLVRPSGGWRRWLGIVSAKRPREGMEIVLPFGRATLLKRIKEGKFLIEFDRNVDYALLERVGRMPLPPYIREYRGPEDRYRTVFGDIPGSVAAPTASLHFTESLLRSLGEMGVEVVYLVLHVGPGTFMPVRTEDIREHRMEEEPYEIPVETANAVNDALDEGRRVIPVGTTVMRALESSASGGKVRPGSGMADVYIYPGYEFRLDYGGFITNFHLPRSTPLLLVSAFAGRDKILRAYKYAIQRKFRFFSFGDSMLIIKKK